MEEIIYCHSILTYKINKKAQYLYILRYLLNIPLEDITLKGVVPSTHEQLIMNDILKIFE